MTGDRFDADRFVSGQPGEDCGDLPRPGRERAVAGVEARHVERVVRGGPVGLADHAVLQRGGGQCVVTAAAGALLARREARYLEASCAVQVLFPLVHILGEVLGTVRPWRLAAGSAGSCSVLTGQLGGVRIAVTVHHEIDPDDPDNHLALLQQITLGTDAGRLGLADTHGPVTWAPRLHIPDSVKDRFDFAAADATHLAEPSLVALDPQPPGYRQILSRWWPAAIGADLLAARARILADGTGPRWGQYHLTLCRLWQEATTALGYPALRPAQTHRPLPTAELAAAVAAAGPEVAAATGNGGRELTSATRTMQEDIS